MDTDDRRQTDIQTDRQTDGRQIKRTDRQTVDKQKEQTSRQTDIQTGKQTTDRETETRDLLLPTLGIIRRRKHMKVTIRQMHPIAILS